MYNKTNGNERNGPNYKQLLDETDEFDRLVLQMAEEGKLKVGMVEVKGNRWHFFKRFLPKYNSH
jgi:hypothetical protein